MSSRIMSLVGGRTSSAPFVLSISSGILLGLSFPPSPFYSLAFVAFIPFFFLWERFTTYKEVFRHSYVFLLVFHLVTVYWTGGYTMGKDIWLIVSNIALVTIHPLFYVPAILIAFFVRRRTNLPVSLAAFALLWISYEYSHSLGEFSFPWLTIGNSQAYDLTRSQIAEFTSVYGISFYLFAFNIIAFMLLLKFARSEWKPLDRKFLLAVLGLVLVYFVPWTIGRVLMQRNAKPAGQRVRVAMIQPNFDPWEKWGEGFASQWDSYQRQFHTFTWWTSKLAVDSPDVVIWPETAIPFHILHPRFRNELRQLFALVDSTRIPVFAGIPHVEYFADNDAPVTAERIGASDTYAQSYNSASLFLPGDRIGGIYKKIVLVPYAERIPYPEVFKSLIQPLKWNVGISSWGKGNDTLVFALPLRSREMTSFSGMICYESVYPNFVRQFVRKGAEFLVVITNDSWWGNTSGAYQHASFASFRAIETRRWVVQCANGGISTVVDPTGTVHQASAMYEQLDLVADIRSNMAKTFYVRHGDVFAHACLFSAALFVFFAVAQRKKNGNGHH